MLKISVVVPIYNVAEYLDKSVGSLLSQTLTEIEIILVNDGSTDDSMRKVKELAEKDSRILAVSQANGGAAAARNNGLKRAIGEYCYFMDPDDWIEPDMLETMYKNAKKDSVELLITGFTNEYYMKGKYFSTLNQGFNAKYLTQQKFRDNAYKLFNNTLIAVPWNKLYLTKFLKNNNLQFPNVKWDDLHFNMEVIRTIEKVEVIDYNGYHFFRTRPGSETTTVFDSSLYNKRREQFTHVLSVFQHWNMLEAECMGVIYYYYASRLVQVIQGIVANDSLSFKKKRVLVKQVLDDDLTVQSLKTAKANSKVFAMFFFPMRNKWYDISIVMGQLVYFLQNKFYPQFQQFRVNVTTKRI